MSRGGGGEKKRNLFYVVRQGEEILRARGGFPFFVGES